MARKTLSDRLNALHTKRLSALEVFTDAALDLEEAAVEYQDLADQACEQATVHQSLAGSATRNAHDAWDKAARIRELVG